MKPPPFQYHDPRTLEEALEMLATKDNTKVLAGGQSLMPMLNMRYVRPDHIVDLNRVPEIAHITDRQDHIRIGSMTRQRDLEFSALVRERWPLMREALLNVGHRQTRNRGTIGGSLCHLDPAAELPSVALAHDATIEVASRQGLREIRMVDFAAGYMSPAIEPHELVVAIRMPSWPDGHGSAFVEFARRHGDFAVASVAALLDVAADGKVRRAAISLGGIGYTPVRAGRAEEIMTTEGASDVAIRRAAEACGETDAAGDVHASAEYRQHLAVVLAARALKLARDRARPSGHRQ